MPITNFQVFCYEYQNILQGNLRFEEKETDLIIVCRFTAWLVDIWICCYRSDLTVFLCLFFFRVDYFVDYFVGYGAEDVCVF